MRGFADYLAAETEQDDAADFRGRLSEQVMHNVLSVTREKHEAIAQALTEETGPEANSVTRYKTESPLSRAIDVEPDIVEDIYIDNAGQILAAPYLSSLEGCFPPYLGFWQAA